MKAISGQAYENNAKVIILFLFQYGFLLPLTIILGGQIGIMIFTFLLLSYVIVTRQVQINTRVSLLFLLPLLLLLLKLPFEPYTEGIDVGGEILYSYLTIGISGILIGTLSFSHEKFLSYGYKIAWLNFFLTGFVPFLSVYNVDISYMRFGYSLLPSVIFAFIYLITKQGNRLFSIILLILTFAELLLFGARGALLTFLIFVILVMLFTPVVNWKKKILFVLSAIFLVVFLPIILKALNEFLFRHNVYSYALVKFVGYFEGQDASVTSSGRNIIYEQAMQRILEAPFFGSPLNTSYIDTGSTYYHSIFFDLLVNFGILGLSAFIFFIGIFFYLAMKRKDSNIRIVFFTILLLPMGRLLISSSFWERPDFWLFMSYCLCNFAKKQPQ